MKIYYMGVVRYIDHSKNEVEGLQLCCAKDISQFGLFQKRAVSPFMTKFAITVAERTRPGQRQDVEEQDYVFHAYGRTEGVAGIIVTDREYPALVAHQLLSKICDEFTTKYTADKIKEPTFDKDKNIDDPYLPLDALKEYIVKYQDPQQADSIMKIQKELDETKIVLHKTIESVLERGEKIDNLVDKSKVLSGASKAFYTKAKSQNSCCVVM
ncbi:snare-like protein [Zopfia rhizophila CBS 207.26]|uniref:Synaptobrevin homolog YKT6 n=1 Tax=Zopfia rhizophila CBS 207.26 TaxID=1314779 RepID=A0A6A6DDK3_9PEZI|nr:snare-like protein [Zopfia rhizophila CBS 207.26]